MAAFKTTLTATQFYTQADPYYYTVDNRPLVDLNGREDAIADELDRRTLAVDITGAATCTVNHVPTGWTIVTNGTGDYTLTHNLGYTTYIALAIILNTTQGLVWIAAQTSTTIQIKTTNLAGTATHLRFQLMVTGY